VTQENEVVGALLNSPLGHNKVSTAVTIGKRTEEDDI